MKRPLIFLVGLAMTAISCSRDGDSLATFKGGAVTRGEFVEWLKGRGLAAKPDAKNRDMMVNELQLLALHKIALLEASKENYGNSERFSFLFGDIRRRYLCSYLMERVIDEKGYSERAVRVRQVLLNAASSGQDKAMRQAREIISELGKGARFEDMVSKYSQHPSKDQGGDLGFLIRDQMPAAYADAVFALKKGEFTKEPVYLGNMNSVCILRVDDVVEVTPKNIENVVPDPKHRARVREIILTRLKDEYVKELMKAGDAVFNEQAAFAPDPAAVLFTIGGEKRTAADLAERMRRMKDIMNEGTAPVDTESRKNIAREFFRDSLLEREAKKRGLDRDAAYRERVDEARESYLAGDYIEHAGTKGMKITPRDVRKEYDLAKEALYYTVVVVNGRQVKRVRPFAEVREQVEKDLRMRMRLEGRERWMKKMIEEYDVKLSPEMLGKSA